MKQSVSSVMVATAENPKEPMQLDLLVDIHDPVMITPALVYWKSGEASGAKTAG